MNQPHFDDIVNNDYITAKQCDWAINHIDGKDKINIDDSVSESYFQEIVQENFDEGFNRGYEKAKKEGEQ